MRRRDCGNAATGSRTSTDDGRRRGAQHAAMPRIVIAGGGVAALEACLALREHVAADELDVTLMTPAARFEYRPIAVLEPFPGISRWSLALDAFAEDLDLDLVDDALTAVGPHARVAVTGAGT